MPESPVIATLLQDYQSLKRLVMGLIIYAVVSTIVFIGLIALAYTKPVTKHLQVSEIQVDVIKAGKIEVTDGVRARYLQAENATEGKSTIVGGSSIFMTIDDKNEGISLVNGPTRYVAIHDDKGMQRLVLGQAMTTNIERGGSITTPESSITGFDKNGHVISGFEVIGR